MSTQTPDEDTEYDICQYCGGWIYDDDQRCMALEDGRCNP